MSDFLQLILALMLIIAAAKAGGLISVWLKQPAVLGELLVGLLLGPTVFNMLHWDCFTCTGLHDQIRQLAELGVVVLMLLAGLELQLPDLIRSGKVAALAGSLGVVVPVIFGWLIASVFFDFSTHEGIFIGLALAATSVSISAQTLMELGKLRGKVGLSMLGAAVFDDILVILLLSLFFALGGDANAASSGMSGVAIVLLRIVGFLVAATLVGLYVLPWLVARVAKLPISQGVVALTVVLTLLFAWSAEFIGGVAAITGAFMAGLFLGRTPYREHIEKSVSVMAYGFFVPIFFVDIGLGVNLFDLPPSAVWFTVVICVAAVLTKLLGSGLGARLGGMTNKESLQLAIGMISRGEVGLIVVSVGVARGIVTNEIFSAVVVMVIVATLLAPPLLRWSFGNKTTPPQAEKSLAAAEAAAVSHRS